MKKIFYLIALLLFFSACKQYDPLEYENDPALYFFRSASGQSDSIAHTFFLLPGDFSRDTVYVDIRTMGYLSDEDRPISIVQENVEDENAAVAGVHYVPFDDPEVKTRLIVPAGKAAVKIPVIILKDKSLDLTEVRLLISIVENEAFRPGIVRQTSFLIKTTSQPIKPTLWNTKWKHVFGASWGAVKMKFIIDVTGYTSWDIYPADSGYLDYLRNKVENAFNKYNMANPDNPLKEADGTLVAFMN